MKKKTSPERTAAEALTFADPPLRKRARVTHLETGEVEVSWDRGARRLTLRATGGPLLFVQVDGDQRTAGEVVADRHLYALLDWIR